MDKYDEAAEYAYESMEEASKSEGYNGMTDDDREYIDVIYEMRDKAKEYDEALKTANGLTDEEKRQILVDNVVYKILVDSYSNLTKLCENLRRENMELKNEFCKTNEEHTNVENNILDGAEALLSKFYVVNHEDGTYELVQKKDGKIYCGDDAKKVETLFDYLTSHKEIG